MRTAFDRTAGVAMRSASLVVGAAVLLAVLAGCGSTTTGADSSIPADAVRVVADELAFQTTELEVPAGQDLVLALENREGVPHNVHIRDAAGATVSRTEIFSGPDTRTQAVPALAPGTYPFICDLHPDMIGRIVAVAEG